MAPTKVVSGTADALCGRRGTTANSRDSPDKKRSNTLGWVAPRTPPTSTTDSAATPGCVAPSTWPPGPPDANRPPQKPAAGGYTAAGGLPPANPPAAGGFTAAGGFPPAKTPAAGGSTAAGGCPPANTPAAGGFTAAGGYPPAYTVAAGGCNAPAPPIATGCCPSSCAKPTASAAGGSTARPNIATDTGDLNKAAEGTAVSAAEQLRGSARGI